MVTHTYKKSMKIGTSIENKLNTVKKVKFLNLHQINHYMF